jgi:hypothetical protein
MREESLDGRSEDIAQEEDETDFITYEIMDRLTKMRRERTDFKLELTQLVLKKTSSPNRQNRSPISRHGSSRRCRRGCWRRSDCKSLTYSKNLSLLLRE